MSEFDSYAGSYAATLNRALAVTGESVDYYAEQRVVHLARRLKERSVSVAKILDFGCGTGTGTPHFLRHLGVTSVTGVDVSNESLQVASSQFADLPAHFENLASFQPRGDFDLAFCNGVFHHIPPMERLKALGIIHRSLRPGGVFAFWENNPWNPGTQWIMHHTPFDQDAVKISPLGARRLLRSAGFCVLNTDSLFYLPRALHGSALWRSFWSRFRLAVNISFFAQKRQAEKCKMNRVLSERLLTKRFFPTML